MEIRLDDLRGEAIAQLLQTHLDHMHSLSPPESVHALDLDALRAPSITFWTAWDGDDLMGCGALKELADGHGEIKSMHTAARHRRRGVAAALLRHVIAEARERSYQRLSLETGSMVEFRAARDLYRAHGFVECGPFGDYRDDPLSAFMTLVLAESVS